jgi:hypothetical protein
MSVDPVPYKVLYPDRVLEVSGSIHNPRRLLRALCGIKVFSIPIGIKQILDFAPG